MMGRLPPGQNELFYEFCLEKQIPADHLLRKVDQFLDLSGLRTRMAEHYSELGRPSVDPELMVRMLLVGYCYGIRSERRLCEEVHLNLAYRWFCRLGLEDQVPHHSTFSKNRHGRFRDGDLLRFVFECVLGRCMDEGLVSAEGFAVDASVIKADAHRARGIPGKDGLDWERPGRKTRAVREYLAALDDDPEQVKTHEATRKAISLTDPGSCWTAGPGGPAFYGYSTNYLVDVASSVIVDVQACATTLSEEAQAARTLIGRTAQRLGLKPKYLAGDTAYGNAKMLGWLVDDMGITPCVPVKDKSEGKAGQFGRSDFIWDADAGHYICPAGKRIKRSTRPYAGKLDRVGKDDTVGYRASKSDCEGCPLKMQCCPHDAARKIRRSIYEEARDVARGLAGSALYLRSRDERKKVEMLFAHLKRVLGLRRLRLRGPCGAHDEFILAATVQNLRKLALRVPAGT